MKPWTEDEDRKLISWGCLFLDGYEFVAQHDLGRTKQEGVERINWLRANKLELVKSLEKVALGENEP